MKKDNSIIYNTDNEILYTSKKYKRAKSVIKEALSTEMKNFKRANLSNMNLNGLDFSKCNLTCANLSNCNLKDTNFHEANCECTDFSYSIFADVNFRSSRLEKANFTSSKFVGYNRFRNLGAGRIDDNVFSLTSFDDACLYSCCFDNALINGVIFSNIGRATLCFNKHECGQFLHFDGAKLTDVEFNNCRLYGTRFCRANLNNVKFTDSVLSGLACTRFTFYDATLKKVSFKNIRLSDVEIHNAKIIKDISIKDCCIDEVTINKKDTDTLLKGLSFIVYS